GYEHVGVWTHDAFLFEEGIAVLSRWPILWSDARDLPHDEVGGVATRAVLGARLDSPFGEAQVFCTHMLAGGTEEEQADQSVAILGFMEDNPSALPSFLGGDLNAEPTTLPTQVLRGDASHDGTTGSLEDGWLAVRAGDDGFTIPSDDPDRRIDYVYAAPGSDGATATPTECSRELTEPEDGVYASDHLAVLCRYSL
ncbi:MAG: endonuclease/exonuclease/phosphatase family protein, partial [Polyangiales bacterium]